MKRRVGSNLNIGTSSLLLIFIVLSLVSFAVLSLSSALTDKNMVMQTMQRSTDYYNACNAAEHKLAEINASLTTAYADNALTNGIHDFEININSNQKLYVALETHKPDELGYCYTITSWKVINESVPEPDMGLNLLIQ
ncbi:MAG: hypothetical protein KBS96_04270 [Lachnospiraceae bacterium]|nr:hypothetical protein [Candidatus Colinaster scatohippi]